MGGCLWAHTVHGSRRSLWFYLCSPAFTSSFDLHLPTIPPDDVKEAQAPSSPDRKASSGSNTYSRLKGGFDRWTDKQRRQTELRRSEHLSMKLPSSCQSDLTAMVHDFLMEFELICQQPTVSVAEMSQAVHKTYLDVEARLGDEQLWQAVDDETANAVANGFQKHIMSQLYELVFTANEEDETKDLNLQEQIRQFRWIEPKHLDAGMDLEKEDVVAAFYKAQEMLIIMDSKRPPSDKLTCVVEASKVRRSFMFCVFVFCGFCLHSFPFFSGKFRVEITVGPPRPLQNTLKATCGMDAQHARTQTRTSCDFRDTLRNGVLTPLLSLVITGGV
jgi:hypothetical protein